MQTKKVEYLDFIKGFAAISVVLLHALPQEFLIGSFAYIHIWQAVPLFVFVSFFLFLRKLDSGVKLKEYYSKKRVVKIVHKIIIPFLIVQLLFGIINYMTLGYEGVISMIYRLGDGRGSYYPYIYCQLWLITPLLYFIFNKMRNLNSMLWGGVIALLSIGCNVAVYYCPILSRFSTTLCIRYLFLSVVAWQWYINKGNLIWRYCLPIISILYWLFLDSIDLDPWIPTHNGWGSQQLPAFFFTYLFVYMLYMLTSRCGKTIGRFFVWSGNNSYYIFLLQMIFFKLFPYNSLGILCGVCAPFRLFLYVACALFCSIFPIIIYKRFKSVNYTL